LLELPKDQPGIRQQNDAARPASAQHGSQSDPRRSSEVGQEGVDVTERATEKGPDLDFRPDLVAASLFWRLYSLHATGGYNNDIPKLCAV